MTRIIMLCTTDSERTNRERTVEPWDITEIQFSRKELQMQERSIIKYVYAWIWASPVGKSHDLQRRQLAQKAPRQNPASAAPANFRCWFSPMNCVPAPVPPRPPSGAA